jgi:hypothetical protein
MHYYATVITPLDGSVDKAVAYMMRPHCENDGANEQGFWDWYVIGGRWTGKWTGYDLRKDPRNYERCFLCQGSGRRPNAESFGQEWLEWSGGCNGCMGTGKSLKFAADLPRHEGDIQPADDVLQRFETDGFPATFITPDGVWHAEYWDGDNFQTAPGFEDQVREQLGKYAALTAVVVDYHR